MKRIGIFGGTFDPVHLGHVAMAHAALAEGLDRLIIMPCKLSPHKLEPGQRITASGDDRYAMLRLAMPDDPRIDLSRYEIDGSDISYTWQTLEYLQEQNPGARLVLIIGMDQFIALDQWSRFADWSGSVDFLVFNREVGANLDTFPLLQKDDLNIQVSSRPVPTVSATQVREHLHSGESALGLIPVQVESYIRDHGLYL